MKKRNKNKETVSLIGLFFCVFSFCIMFLPVPVIIKNLYKRFSWLMEGLMGVISVSLTFALMIGPHIIGKITKEEM